MAEPDPRITPAAEAVRHASDTSCCAETEVFSKNQHRLHDYSAGTQLTDKQTRGASIWLLNI